MNESKLVAIIGRPNVGKSRLFNRLAHRRISIVHDKPGVTRDVVSVDLPDGYTLMDTGGIGLEDKSTAKVISQAMETQAMVAIETATLILFITDGQEGMTPLDMEIAEFLHSHQNKVMIVTNKMDNPEEEGDSYEFAKLGFGQPVSISAEHNHGLDELEEEIKERLAPLVPISEEDKHRITISLVGKPNAGKSSLGNRLLKEERFIVADVAGTTRDMIETSITYTDRNKVDWDFRLFDTAGLRPKRKMDSSVEYFSSVRTQRSIERSDIVIHLVDAKEGISKQDKIIAGQILDEGKALIIAVTKWDYAVDAYRNGDIEGYDNLQEFKIAYEKRLRKDFFYLPHSPIVFTSSESGKGVDELMEAVIALNTRLSTKISTPKLNKLISDLTTHKSPAKSSGKRFKIFYAVQIGNRPFRIKVFCNRAERLEAGYRRYLEKNFVKEFGLNGCPFVFNLIGKEERYRNKDD